MRSLIRFRVVYCVVLLTLIVPMTSCPQPWEKPPETASFAGIEFIWCVPGPFMMGSPPTDSDAASDEFPQHQVTFSKGFWISRYPITQGQWKHVMGSNPSRFQGGTSGSTDNRPVERVTWIDVQSFITALNAANPNLNFRLPSEAEWEYACRATTTTRFFWGDDPEYTQIDNFAWYEDNSGNQTHDVGTKQPNLWRIFDMSGNVYQWVQDTWSSDYTITPTDGTAYEDYYGEATARVLRGGSYANQPFRCRATARTVWAQNIAGDNFGFRLAKF